MIAIWWAAAGWAQDACPEPPPTAEARRTRLAGGVTVQADQRVESVIVVAGVARIDGTVDKSVTVLGGSVTLGPCARIGKNVTTVAGLSRTHRTAVVHGDDFVVLGVGYDTH